MIYNKEYISLTTMVLQALEEKITKHWDSFAGHCTTGQVISLSIQNVQHVVKFLVNPNLDVSNTANSVCYTSIQPQIDKLLVKYNSIIPADNDKPSTTDLVEFTIDTGDSPPVYSA